MVQVLEAVFDGAVLHPDTRIELEPNTRVRITIETVEPGEIKPVSFLQTARSLKLEGPADWSERFEDYLYGRDAEAQE